jgi:hypothetical protein
MKTKLARKKRRSPAWPGLTIAQFAQAKKTSERIIRGLVKSEKLATVDCNGITIMAPVAHQQWESLFGLAAVTAGATAISPAAPAA